MVAATTGGVVVTAVVASSDCSAHIAPRASAAFFFNARLIASASASTKISAIGYDDFGGCGAPPASVGATPDPIDERISVSALMLLSR